MLDRLLGHDGWTTRQLLEICESLAGEQLDREFDIGHRTLRGTLDHIISNMEIWAALMADQEVPSNHDQTLTGMIDRLAVAETRLKLVARKVADTNMWDELWTDHLDDPPRQKSFGTAIAHVITHSMHHRAQVLYMLRLSGVESLPEGDVFSWETATGPQQSLEQ
nr:DinB family protein [Planctomicrobium sp.]